MKVLVIIRRHLPLKVAVFEEEQEALEEEHRPTRLRSWRLRPGHRSGGAPPAGCAGGGGGGRLPLGGFRCRVRPWAACTALFPSGTYAVSDRVMRMWSRPLRRASLQSGGVSGPAHW